MSDPIPRRFRLVRYFTEAGLAAFLAVGAVLYFLEKKEGDYFREVQEEQGAFVKQLQDDFVRGHDRRAREDLLAVHEAGHVTLTRTLANALWGTHVAPLLAGAERIALDHCHVAAWAEKHACFQQAGRRIQALPEFRALDRKLAETVRGTEIFKIKVFDLRGLTVYSSEHAQVGEDKRDNQGWQLASAGRPASELTRRDTFSAFEGVVENRDLISSYVPVLPPGEPERIAGVFEIYSDVTPLLARVRQGTARLAEQSVANQERLARASMASRQIVEEGSRKLLVIVLGLLALLFAALLFIVRRAQRILDAQEKAREEWIARESRWHKERMAALGAMAASIAHEVGNPLAVISGIAQDVASPQILQQAERIAEKTRRMADFASAHGEAPQLVDVNEVVGGICEFLAFDHRFRSTPIDFRPGPGLPAPVAAPDHLTEAVMNLLLLYVSDERANAAPGKMAVSTAVEGERVAIRVECEPRADGPALSQAGVDAVARRVAAMGGEFSADGLVSRIALPVATELPA